jgi:hypothetical protein
MTAIVFPRHAYHASPTRNRLSIFRRGLLARGPGGGNRWRPAVYVMEDPTGWTADRPDHDVWEVDLAGLSIELDPAMMDLLAGALFRMTGNKCYRVTRSIPPARLRLYKRGER